MVNIEAVKEYNKQLRAAKETAARQQGEISADEKELERICKELSSALAIPVTPENIEAVHAELSAKVEQMLASGKEILGMAEREASMQANIQQQQTTQMPNNQYAGFQQAQPQQQQVQQVQQVQQQGFTQPASQGMPWAAQSNPFMGQPANFGQQTQQPKYNPNDGSGSISL